MSRQPRGSVPAPTVASRQNEYFVPRDGIDREVISADICRYLGNDALVRPGQYENPQTGQVVQGYYINAYRNLTTAMIEDLKADSARWDSERRAQTSRNTGPGVQYRLSETHQSRQHYGPSSDGSFPSDPYGREPGFDQPRYPGTGAHGYTGAAPHQQQQSYPSGTGNGFGFSSNQQTPSGPSGFAPGPQSGSMMNSHYGSGQDAPYIATGANSSRFDPYGSSRGGSASSAAPPQPVYVTAPPPQSSYPASYQYSGQASQPSGHPGINTPDGYYARGPSHPPQQPGFSPQAPPQGQYDEPRATVSSHSKAQTPPAGSSNRRSDRDADRHHRGSRR